MKKHVFNMKKCDFCVKSLQDGTCSYEQSVSSDRESACASAIEKMVKVYCTGGGRCCSCVKV